MAMCQIYFTYLRSRWLRSHHPQHARTTDCRCSGLLYICYRHFLTTEGLLQVEREMGSGGFVILYMAAGIFGYECVSFTPLYTVLITGLQKRSWWKFCACRSTFYGCFRRYLWLHCGG